MKVSERIRKLSSDSELGLTANQLRIVIAIERAVARLENDPKLRDHLIFKGGFVLRYWRILLETLKDLSRALKP